MNETDRELLDGLRALASDGPREAPAYIEQRLAMEFRRQNRRRNLVTWVPMASAAAALVIGLLLWTHGLSPRKLVLAPVAAVAQSAPAVEEESDFYPLPEAEALPEVENAMVVRVQLPVSSLRMMGVPVGEESAGTNVQAELLLGQDGLARAVRLAE